jgi:hypothetical protein
LQTAVCSRDRYAKLAQSAVSDCLTRWDQGCLPDVVRKRAPTRARPGSVPPMNPGVPEHQFAVTRISRRSPTETHTFSNLKSYPNGSSWQSRCSFLQNYIDMENLVRTPAYALAAGRDCAHTGLFRGTRPMLGGSVWLIRPAIVGRSALCRGIRGELFGMG